MESFKGWKHALPSECMASWKLIQAGKESDWEVKTVCRLDNRIFILGKPEGNDEFEIFVYDVDGKVWEALDLDDVLYGPQRSQFYASVAIPNREWVLVFWENILPQDSGSEFAIIESKFKAKDFDEIAVDVGTLVLVIEVAGKRTLIECIDKQKGVFRRGFVSSRCMRKIAPKEYTKMRVSVLDVKKLCWLSTHSIVEVPSISRGFVPVHVKDDEFFLVGGYSREEQQRLIQEGAGRAAMKTDLSLFKCVITQDAGLIARTGDDDFMINFQLLQPEEGSVTPSARFRHGCALVPAGSNIPSRLFVSGGESPLDGRLFHDSHFFNMETHVWSKWIDLPLRMERLDIGFVHIASHLILVGGLRGDRTVSNEIFCAKIHDPRPGGTKGMKTKRDEWVQVRTTGDHPIPRYGAFVSWTPAPGHAHDGDDPGSGVIAAEQTCFIFGGVSGSTRFFDSYSLTLPFQLVAPEILEQEEEEEVESDGKDGNVSEDLEDEQVDRKDAYEEEQEKEKPKRKECEGRSSEAKEVEKSSPEDKEEKSQKVSGRPSEVETPKRSEELRASSPTTATTPTSPSQRNARLMNPRLRAIHDEIAVMEALRSSSSAPTSPSVAHSPTDLAMTPSSPTESSSSEPISPSGTPSRPKLHRGLSILYQKRRTPSLHVFADLPFEAAVDLRGITFGVSRPVVPGKHTDDGSPVVAGDLTRTREFLNACFEAYNLASRERGDSGLNVLDIAMFCRISCVMDNVTDIVKTYRILQSVLHKGETDVPDGQEAPPGRKELPKQVLLQADEPVSQEQFHEFVKELALIKYPGARRDAKGAASGPLHWLVEDFLAPNAFPCKTEIFNDPATRAILSPQTCEIYDEYQTLLREMFVIYSTLDILAVFTPSWEEVVRHNAKISAGEFDRLTENFEIVPNLFHLHVVNRHFVSSMHAQEEMDVFSPQSKKLKYSYATQGDGLSFAEFQELLGRFAHHLYESAGPEYPKNQRDRLELFFNSALSFENKKQYTHYLKRVGLRSTLYLNEKQRERKKKGSPLSTQDDGAGDHGGRTKIATMSDVKADQSGKGKGSPRTPGKSTVVSLQNVDKMLTPKDRKEILSRKSHVLDVLQKVFFYYSSYGQHNEAEILLSEHQFRRFLRDISIMDGKTFKLSHSSIVWMEYRNSRHERREKRADFRQFTELLDRVCTKKFPNLALEDGFEILFLDHIVPLAKKSRIKDEMHVDLMSDDIQDLLEKYHRTLRLMYHTYCAMESIQLANWSAIDSSLQTLSIHEILLLATDFNIVPDIISKPQLFRIFRASFEDPSSESSFDEDLTFDEFEECMVRVAAVGYSRHPWDKKYPTISSRVEALFEKLGLGDYQHVRSALEKKGYSLAIMTSSRATVEWDDEAELESSLQASASDMVDLPGEKELQKQLHAIFVHYASEGDVVYSTGAISSHKYQKFAKDCRILTKSFGVRDIDLVYSEITRGCSLPFRFDGFVRSLSLLAQRKLPGKTEAQALRLLLCRFVLPYAKKDHTLTEKLIEGGVAHQEMVDSLRKYERQLHMIFTKYCILEDARAGKPVSGRVDWEDVAHSNKSMSVAEFDRFATDFEIVPDLMTRMQATQLFAAVNFSEVGDEDFDSLNFEEFVDCIGHCAVIGYGSDAWRERYPTTTDRVHALCSLKLGLDDVRRLQDRLTMMKTFRL
eukprot:TRINITY_DN81585_c0_g1_i1.p1 TRINITY_DN81585_c0_g1~~TRINITY_DN81585_c0_g1_i1.p1  ORF type:complete len:1673 (-),score=452.35 TRINITY_DN81585_c0_g1_i1:1654-6672(-)